MAGNFTVELRNVPQPPGKGGRAVRNALRRRKRVFDVEATPDQPNERIRRFRRSRSSSGSTRWLLRVLRKIGVRFPSIGAGSFRMAALFKKKRRADGRNHGFTGVKKRNGRTGLAGR